MYQNLTKTLDQVRQLTQAIVEGGGLEGEVEVCDGRVVLKELCGEQELILVVAWRRTKVIKGGNSLTIYIYEQ